MERKDLRRTFKLTPHEEALRQLIDAARVEPLGPEEVALERSVGRVLAVDIISRVNVPEKTHAVFDGYAIRSADTRGVSAANPVMLKIVGKTFPGEAPHELSSGQAVFAACGAPLPKGADAVVKTENVRLLEDKIEIRFPIEPGENVALLGEDVKKGRLILRKGHLLRPQDVGLLAGIRVNSVKVFRKPRVGIISVGDELVKLSGEDPSRTANNHALIISSLVSEFGGIPQLFGIVPDDLGQIKERISEAMDKADIAVTIAGCSVGVKDLVPDAINALSGPGIVFHGVKLSPGRVMGAGVVKGKPIVMLPGHIVSAYAGFYLLLVPLIAKHSGLKAESLLPVVRAKIAQDVRAKPIATFLRVHLTRVNDEFVAKPVHGGSSALTTLVNSHGYTIVPRGKGLEKGTSVDVVLYDRQEFADFMSAQSRVVV
jgi:molybdenum cofactor synthesis domain-containing protein